MSIKMKKLDEDGKKSVVSHETPTSASLTTATASPQQQMLETVINKNI